MFSYFVWKKPARIGHTYYRLGVMRRPHTTSLASFMMLSYTLGVYMY